MQHPSSRYVLGGSSGPNMPLMPSKTVEVWINTSTKYISGWRYQAKSI
ncbi:hypothetical protein BHMPCIPO_01563 [Ensifer sesbaniae]|nr:hypothetical protein [Ensifer sesbaniae]